MQRASGGNGNTPGRILVHVPAEVSTRRPYNTIRFQGRFVLSRKVQDGVIFVSECVNHFFTPKDIRCPHCDGVLQEKIATEGEASLFCSTTGKRCGPVKSFESAQEMYRWRDSIWEVLARTCKQHQ